MVVNDFENITSLKGPRPEQSGCGFLYNKIPYSSKKESMYSIIRIKGNINRWKGIALKPFFIA